MSTPVGDESVMQGGGAYSANSRPQHVAAAVAYPYLERASAEVPIGAARPIVIGDLGCAGGANEMEPMQRAIDVLRRRDSSTPIEVVHTDLPHNDFAPLFARLATTESYTDGRAEVNPRVVGQTLYGPLFPARTLSLVWCGITLHWLSGLPVIAAATVYGNLTTGADRAALQAQSKTDWDVDVVARDGRRRQRHRALSGASAGRVDDEQPADGGCVGGGRRSGRRNRRGCSARPVVVAASHVGDDIT